MAATVAALNGGAAGYGEVYSVPFHPDVVARMIEDVCERYRAYGWHTLSVDDGNDLDAIEAAIREGMAETERPTLISLRTVIGYGSPRAGTRNAHSDPMPDEQVRQIVTYLRSLEPTAPSNPDCRQGKSASMP